MNDMQSEEFNLLNDHPFSEEDLDRFGYTEIARSLISLINKAQPPFTIGLYGQWGVGKSSICKLVEKEFRSKDEYEIFYFDTWKYERDSFRRQFLIELDNDIFKGKLEYQTKLNQSLTVPYSFPFWERVKKSFVTNFGEIFLKLVIPGVCLLIFLVFVWLLGKYTPHFLTVDWQAIFHQITGALLVFGTMVYLARVVFESIKIINGQAEIPRTDSAEGFEFYYKEALQKLGNKKLLVVIDNLDRLDHERAVDLLSDIKTFLANGKISGLDNKAIFLIPCDNEPINNQLKKVYGDDIDCEEYLRKFFNSSIKIPRLLDLELDKFVIEKLEETEIKEFSENEQLSFVISRAFRNNPREIIQFIDSLIILFLLAKTRELKDVYVKEKNPFLAKVLTLRVKWPHIYSFVENEIVRTGKSLEEVMHDHRLTESKFPRLEDCKEFLKTTAIVREEDREELFFTLKETDGSDAISEWPIFILATEDRREEDVRSSYEAILKKDKLRELNRLLSIYIKRNSEKKTKLYNVLISISRLINDSNLVIFEPFLSSIFDVFYPNELALLLSEIDFSFVFNSSFLNLSSTCKKVILDRLAGISTQLAVQHKSDPTVVSCELNFWELIDKQKDLFKKYRSNLSEAKKQYLTNLQIPPLLSEKPIQEKFLKSVVEFAYSEFPLGSDMFFNICDFSFKLLQQESLQNKEILIYILEKILAFFDKNPTPQDIDPVHPQYRQITSQLHALSNMSDWDVKSLTLKILLKLDIGDKTPQRPELVTRIANYIGDINNLDSIILKNFTIEELKGFLVDQNTRNQFKERTASSPGLFLAFNEPLSFWDDQELRVILTRLLNGKAPEFIKIMRHAKYQIPHHLRDEIVLGMINQLNLSDINLFKEWLEIIEKLGIPSSLLPNLINQLRMIKQSNTSDRSEIIKEFVGRNISFFGEAQAEEFLK